MRWPEETRLVRAQGTNFGQISQTAHFYWVANAYTQIRTRTVWACYTVAHLPRLLQRLIVYCAPERGEIENP